MSVLSEIAVSVKIVLALELSLQDYTDTTNNIKSTNDNPPQLISDWQYQEEEVKMTSKKIQFASITATELLIFEFPYDGGSVASFTIRKKPGSLDSYLRVSKGQFNSTFEGGTVRIRFDENQPKRYSFSEASDGSSDIIFINSTKEIISKIKAAKHMIIEAEFYDEGHRQIEFNVANLKWD